MGSIEQIKASDGTGNANIATVQSSRSSGATTIDVDTVLGINPAGFAGSMGTPHTFTDPITSEVITVISEATAVDFTGHVDGSNLEIDDIAPGYVDGGSEVGDIVIIRPTTQYADNLADVLEVAHNDSGSLKNNAVNTNVIEDGAITFIKLLATIFGGQVQTQANAGTASGTMSYINLGGIKLLWIDAPAQTSTTTGAPYGVTLPTSFFTTVTAVLATATKMTTDGRQYIAVNSFSVSTLVLTYVTAVNATTGASILVIGT